VVYNRKIVAIPPGATIREQLKARGMTQKEFAQRMNLSEKHISRLVNGDVELTPEVALRLEYVLGIPASFWNNLEAIYRERLKRIEEAKHLDKEIEIANKFDYREMAKLQWVPETKQNDEKVYNLRYFFEVSDLTIIDNLPLPNIVYRKTNGKRDVDYKLLAWVQKARLEARKIKTGHIDISKLESFIPEIRKMTVQDPDVFYPTLVEKLAQCGVALVLLPQISGSFLHGATFYDGNRIVMGLTLRGKDADKFWFSLLHELGHILQGHLKLRDIMIDELEEAGDNFARDVLIPPREYMRFLESACFTKKCIVQFARQIGIAPCIVLGRLQKEGFVPYNKFNELKIKYSRIEYLARRVS